jgi:hypothetical protein
MRSSEPLRVLVFSSLLHDGFDGPDRVGHRLADPGYRSGAAVLKAELPLIVGSAIYIGLNLYLWSLHPGRMSLFAISWVLGIIYFAGFFWHIARTSK